MHTTDKKRLTVQGQLTLLSVPNDKQFLLQGTAGQLNLTKAFER
jgi:hypothetical protein